MDVLLHEIGWSSEFYDKESGEAVLLPFDTVADLLDDKIKFICEEVWADEPPTLFISSSPDLLAPVNKLRRWQGESEIEFVPNFRYAVAKSRPYKGTRKNPKPFHFYNIAAYVTSKYDVVYSEDGLEADDMMCIAQTEADPGTTIICSRDKDLRICPGNHYSWECGSQKAVGPVQTDSVGWLELHVTEKRKPDGKIKKEKKVVGYGLSFFYYQLLVGDTADNIPGLPGCGLVAAYDALHKLKTEEEMYTTVKKMYKKRMGTAAKEYFFEQANLLYMIQERTETGDPRFYKVP